MVITAKYASTCPDCGNTIREGSKVQWERGQKARHVSCPNGGTGDAAPQGRGRKSWAKPLPSSSNARAPRAVRNPQPKLATGEQFVQRAGNDPAPYTVGETLRFNNVTGGGGPDGHYWTVTWASGSRRGNEDNQEFERRIVSGHVRPATDGEAAPVAERIAAANAKKEGAETLCAVLSASKSGHTYDGPPAEVETIWEESRPAGSERWSADPSGQVYYTSSDYDMGPSTWTSSATKEQVEALRATGLYRPNLQTRGGR